MAPIVVLYWADLQSVHGLRWYDNITRTRNVSEHMLVLALCLVRVLQRAVHSRRRVEYQHARYCGEESRRQVLSICRRRTSGATTLSTDTLSSTPSRIDARIRRRPMSSPAFDSMPSDRVNYSTDRCCSSPTRATWNAPESSPKKVRRTPQRFLFSSLCALVSSE